MSLIQSSVQNVLAARARLGECPLWDETNQRLYWVDIYNQRVHEFDPTSRRDRYFDMDSLVSAIALAGTAQLLVALRDRLVFLNLQTGSIENLYQIKFSHPDTRLNDGKCDPQGRFWVGSTSFVAGQAALYRYDPDGSLHLMETGLSISNGLGWSPDGATFYLTDSAQHKIFTYRFDAQSGSISDRRILVDLGNEAVEPDGLAIDQQGNLWSALWDGWCIVCFNSIGQEIFRVKMPVQRPTCPTFGGTDLTDLYITSASVGLSQKEIQQGFYAGDLFHLSTVYPGIPAHRFYDST